MKKYKYTAGAYVSNAKPVYEKKATTVSVKCQIDPVILELAKTMGMIAYVAVAQYYFHKANSEVEQE